jgi:HEAT repeat protein
MCKRRFRLIAFLVVSLSLVMLSLPLAAREKPKPKPELWQIDGTVAAIGDAREGVGEQAVSGKIENIGKFDRQSLKTIATPKHTQTLIAIFKDEKFDSKVRVQAIRVLGMLGDEANSYAKDIADILKNDKIDANTRIGAVYALGNLSDAEPYVKDILDFLKDEKIDANVRVMATPALSAGAAKPYARDILDFLKDEKIAENVRMGVAYALSNLGDAANPYGKDILDFLKDDRIDTNVRISAVYALENLSDAAKPYVKDIADILKDDRIDTNVRISAAKALGNLSDAAKPYVKDIADILKDDEIDANMRGGAAEALGNLGDAAKPYVKDILDFLKDDRIDTNVRISAVYALGNLSDAAKPYVKDIADILKDDRIDTNVRISAVYALGNLSDAAKPYVKDIADILKDDRIDANVRSGVAKALGNLGDAAKPYVKDIADFLKDDKIDANVRSDVAEPLTKLTGKLNLETVSFLVGFAYQERDSADNDRFNAYYYSGGDEQVTRLLKWVAKPKHLPQTIDRPEAIKTLKVFASAWEASANVPEFRADLANKTALVVSKVTWLPQDLPLLKRQYDRLSAANMNQAAAIQQTIFNLEGIRWVFMVWQAVLAHLAFWLALIFAYPKSPQIQAIFFWNPWIRNILGVGYVSFLLQWIPFLRRKLFEPFKTPLLADAGLDYFNPDRYFPQSTVLPPNGDRPLPLQQALPNLKGQLILEGASGLGKTMFLRHLLQQSDRITVYLPATKCNEGVIEAIQIKLHGEEIKDHRFLQSLIYSGAIDICIDGLNEVSPDTRAKITQFVESHFRGNILLTTQPLEWIAPNTAKTYILQPLERPAIQSFLESRKPYFPDAPADYTQRIQMFLARSLDQQDDAEKNSAARILSNPMDLSIVAGLIAHNQQPDLAQLKEQQYQAMAKVYQEEWNKAFPLAKFAEAVYQMRLNDVTAIDAATFSQEIQSLAGDRFKMVIRRQWKTKSKDPEKPDELQEEWTFRHDKIAEFFIAQTFLGENEIAKQRIEQHISDPRFRGVYFLLATTMPDEAAAELREYLIQYAAESKDHSVSDEFVLRFGSRRSGAAPGKDFPQIRPNL